MIQSWHRSMNPKVYLYLCICHMLIVAWSFDYFCTFLNQRKMNFSSARFTFRTSKQAFVHKSLWTSYWCKTDSKGPPGLPHPWAKSLWPSCQFLRRSDPEHDVKASLQHHQWKAAFLVNVYGDNQKFNWCFWLQTISNPWPKSLSRTQI